MVKHKGYKNYVNVIIWKNEGKRKIISGKGIIFVEIKRHFSSKILLLTSKNSPKIRKSTKCQENKWMKTCKNTNCNICANLKEPKNEGENSVDDEVKIWYHKQGCDGSRQ